MMWKKTILFLTICALASIGSGFQSNQKKSLEYLESEAKIDWELWLPAIKQAESSNNLFAESWIGKQHGRGPYQISEIALKEFKKYNAKYRYLTPEHLYNEHLSRMIALWTLEKHERDFRKTVRGNIIPWVLSCYNQGAYHTINYGVSQEYVNLVFNGMKK